MRSFLAVAAVAIAAASLACAHAERGGGAEGARKAAELFHHRARWKDFGGAALLVAEERRAAFERARRALNDDRELSIADYELDEIGLEEDGVFARVVSRISWHRLPSASQHDDTVTTELQLIGGSWKVVRQTGGPFDAELSAP